MRSRLLLLGLSLALCLPAIAQSEVDVTQLAADTKTFIFSDNKHTVKTYIYDEIEGKTTCCGSDRIYLEVKIDPSGYVLDAKTLTGKNDCFKKSAMDIVKNIKWDAKGFKGPKSVYFEIKPEIECSGECSNAYAQVAIFHNELLDEKGLPLNHAQSSGVSASKSSGTVSAPTGMPTEPPAVADAGSGADQAAGQQSNDQPAASGQQTEQTPAADQGAGAGTDAAQTAAATPPASSGGDQPAGTSADAELGGAMALASMEREKQEEEINKLKEELAAMKAAEEAKKKEEEEAARRAEEEKERQAMAERQRQREEEEARRREAEAAKTASRNNDSYQSGGFQDVNYDTNAGYDNSYADNNRGGGYDNRGGGYEEEPPRQLSPEQRAAEEKRQMEDEKRQLEDKMRQMEADSRRQQADRERFAQDLARVEERILRKDEEIRKEREREELERLETARREAEERRRTQEREVQEAMDQLKRMQADLDRKLADLQRQEEELKLKEQEKVSREQQITAEQQLRQQQLEAELDRMKMQSGLGMAGTSAPGDMPVASTADLSGLDSSGAMALLVSEIRTLQGQISVLNNKVNAMSGGTAYTSGSSTQTSRGNSGATKTSTRQQPGAPTSAASNKSWNKIDYRNPEKKDDPIYANYGQEKKTGSSSNSKNHANMTIPNAPAAKYKGGNKAMKSFIAQELQKGGICGLAQAAFEVTVDGSGQVQGYRIIKSNDFNVEAQMMNILPKLQFEATGSRVPQTTITEFKAEIICDGTERINIQEVNDIINK